jgi:hemolysin-activating ACP:hemolysin acyltransferase
MWGRRQETQAEACIKEAQPQAPVSAPASAGAGVPEIEAPHSINVDTLSPDAGQQPAAADAPESGQAVQAPASALDEKTQAFWRGKLAAAHFASAVSLFLRSPAHRHYTLADLEWCLLPALALNQYMAGEARLPDGQAVPTALVLWARVSAEIDARLSAGPRYPIRLHSNEWQSGDVIWIVDAVGEQKAVQQCIEALAKMALQGKPFKMLSLEGGKLTVVQRVNEESRLS